MLPTAAEHHIALTLATTAADSELYETCCCILLMPFWCLLVCQGII